MSHFRDPTFGTELTGLLVSGAAIAGASTFQTFVRTVAYPRPNPEPPVSASKKEMIVDLSLMDADAFYEVDYQGEKYAVRLTKKGILETYVVKEAP